MTKGFKQYFRLLAEDREQGVLSKLMYPLLTVASSLYGGVSQKTRRLYQQDVLKSKKLNFPVISVGNLTWGGSGKTPLVEYLVHRIQEMKKSPLILTRGYGHDEVEQYREHFPDTLIGVGKNRYKSALKISNENKVDVGILDDGYQHWALQRDLEIVTLNALSPFGNYKLIPRGSLREPVGRLADADIVVINHANLVIASVLRDLKMEVQNIAPKAVIVEACFEPLFFYRAKKGQKVGVEKMQDRRVTTFSAVGVPRSFQLILSNSRIKPVRNFEFTDHHKFSKKDLEEIKAISEVSSSEDIVTTEKDFYRAPQMIIDHINPLVLATELRIVSGEELLLERLRSLVGVSL